MGVLSEGFNRDENRKLCPNLCGVRDLNVAWNCHNPLYQRADILGL